MNKIKKYIPEILLFIVFCIFSLFLPNTLSDMTWANEVNSFNLSALFSMANGNLISCMLLILLNKYKFLKVLTYAWILMALFTTMKTLVNKNNNTILYIGVFLFLIMGENILNTVLSSTGFINIIASFLLILIVLNLFRSDITVKKIILIITGLLISVFNIYVSITFLLYCFFHLSLNKDKYKKFLPLIIPVVIVTVINILYNGIIFSPNSNLINQIMPFIMSSSFIILIIEIAFLLYLCIKIYLKSVAKDKVFTILSLIIVTAYGFAYLLSANNTLNYILFILFMISSYFILTRGISSTKFKNKINEYYLLKLSFLITLILLDGYDIYFGAVFYLFDILIILELINYIFPEKFLNKVWYVISLFTCIFNIYLYSRVSENLDEISWYVMINLSCDKSEIKLPSKYSSLSLYIPKSKKEKENYLKYYEIEYDKDYVILLKEE